MKPRSALRERQITAVSELSDEIVEMLRAKRVSNKIILSALTVTIATLTLGSPASSKELGAMIGAMVAEARRRMQ